MVPFSVYRFQVGDQILRVNGYPVEDAVHQEVALLAKNQQVLVLKIRSNYLVSILIIYVVKYNIALTDVNLFYVEIALDSSSRYKRKIINNIVIRARGLREIISISLLITGIYSS